MFTAPNLELCLPEAMQQLYWVTEVTVPQLLLAAERTEGELHEYFLKHAEEERGHAEWLKSDLENFGVTEFPTNPAIEAAVGRQYFILHHKNPSEYLGYVWSVESKHPTLEMVEALEKVWGKALLGCIRHHAENDPQHCRDLKEQIMKCSEEERRAIKDNIDQTDFFLAQAADQLYRDLALKLLRRA